MQFLKRAAMGLVVIILLVILVAIGLAGWWIKSLGNAYETLAGTGRQMTWPGVRRETPSK